MSRSSWTGFGPVWRSPFGSILMATIAAVVMYLISWNKGVEWKIGLVLTLSMAIIAFLLRLVCAQLAETPKVPTYEIFLDQGRALRKADQLVKGGDVVWAMWTAMSYTKELQDYYRDTMSGLHSTLRIIDLEIELTDIRDHLKENWEALRSVRYEVYFIRRLDFELLLVDYKKAGVFLSAGPGYGYLVLAGEGEIAGCVRGMLDQVRTVSTAFPANEFSSEFDEEKVLEWLRKARGETTA